MKNGSEQTATHLHNPPKISIDSSGSRVAVCRQRVGGTSPMTSCSFQVKGSPIERVQVSLKTSGTPSRPRTLMPHPPKKIACEPAHVMLWPDRGGGPSLLSSMFSHEISLSFCGAEGADAS